MHRISLILRRQNILRGGLLFLPFLLSPFVDSSLFVRIQLPAGAGGCCLGRLELHLGELNLRLQELSAVGPGVGAEDVLLHLLHLAEDGRDEVQSAGLYDVITRGGTVSVSHPWILTMR